VPPERLRVQRQLEAMAGAALEGASAATVAAMGHRRVVASSLVGDYLPVLTGSFRVALRMRGFGLLDRRDTASRASLGPLMASAQHPRSP
jgi:hypothetical protein